MIGVIELLAVESWQVTVRHVWIAIGIGYFAAAVILAVSEWDYPVWTWSVFLFVAAAILISFNVDKATLAPVFVQIIEIAILIAAIVIGWAFFWVLWLIGPDLDSGMIELPPLRKLPGFLIMYLKDMW